MRKKFFAGVLATTMVVSAMMTAVAGNVDVSKIYNPAQVIDGSEVWNTSGGDNYLISETAVTVKFTNTPFIRDSENWYNFVFETLGSDGVKGVTMRADAYSWPYGEGSEPKVVSETSWGSDWDYFVTMCKENTAVTLTAKKADANTVTFDIAFGSAGTEKYTVTYADGVPDDLRFHVGADGGKIEVNEVRYGDSAEIETSPSVYVQYKLQKDGNYTVRVVGEVALEGAFTENLNVAYDGVGFRCAKSLVGMNSAENYVSTVVFKSLVANGATVTAADGKYFIVTEITDVAKDATIYASPVYVTADKNDGVFTDKKYTINMANIIK